MTFDATQTDSVTTGALMRRAAAAAVAVAGTLALLKLGAWAWTGSVAMLASFADSALDFAASGINALAIRHALTPADREHRFGHGKSEAVAGLAQAALVGGSGVFLALESGKRLLWPQPLDNEGWGIGVMAISMAATLGLVMYQRHVVRRTGSVAVAADSLHYVTDLAANAAVILALVMAGWFGLMWADGAFGLIIAALVGHSAWSIMDQSFNQLIDRELPDDERQRIKQIIRTQPGVLDVHDLRTRSSGTAIFIQCHVVLDAQMRLIEAHAIADAVEAAVQAEYPSAEVLIHEDPSGVREDHQVKAFGAGE
jgi:ferrous-iron efflux pump FieF